MMMVWRDWMGKEGERALVVFEALGKRGDFFSQLIVGIGEAGPRSVSEVVRSRVTSGAW